MFFIYKSLGKIFDAQGHVTPKPTSPLWPEMEFVQHFMPVLVNCKFEEDPIKTKTFFFSGAQGQVTDVNGRMWPEFEFFRAFMAVLVRD